MPQWTSRFAPALILFAITIAVNWKLALTNQYTWLDGNDLSRQILPWFQEEAAQIRHTRLPLYDMHHWGGQSLIGQDQPGVLFPLNWILFLMREWHGRLALQFANWYYVVIHYLAALFCYWLARDLQLSRFASICAGASFGVSGLMGSVSWPQMLNGGMWAPLILLFAIRALDRRRPYWNMGVAGCITGFSFFSGHHQLPTFTILAVGMLALYAAISGRVPYRTAALLGFIYIAFTILAGSPQLLPSYEYWTHGLRWVGAANPVGFHDRVPYAVFDQFSVNPISIFWLFYPGSFPAAMHYVGLTVVAFAVFACISGRRSTRFPTEWVGPFLALAVAAFLFSLGKYSVFHGVLYSILPFLDKSRNAAYGMFITDLALAVLAGFGVDLLLSERDRLQVALRRFGNVLLAAGAFLSAVLLVRGAVQGDKVFEDTAFAYVAISALLLGAVVRAWQLDRIPVRAAMLGILGLILFEIGAITNRDLPHIEGGWPWLYQLSRHADLAVALHAEPGLFRVQRNDQDITYNFGDWYGIDEDRGYAGVTSNVFVMSGEPHAGALLGVKYLLSHEPHDSETEPMFRGESGVNIYRIPDAFPRAWTVHAADSVSNEEQARQHMNVPLERLATRTFLIGPAPSLDVCSGKDTVRITESRKMEFFVDADMACKGMVVIGNTFFPGWRAEVDGQSAQVHEAYHFLDGVVVGSGHHRVRLWYHPVPFYWGVAMAALAVAGLVVLRRGRV
jgi:hypothetical protein